MFSISHEAVEKASSPLCSGIKHYSWIMRSRGAQAIKTREQPEVGKNKLNYNKSHGQHKRYTQQRVKETGASFMISRCFQGLIQTH